MESLIKKKISDIVPKSSLDMMRICVFISFIFHIVILFALQKAFPSYWNMEEYRTYEVELIRAPVEDLESGDSSQSSLAHMNDEDTEEVSHIQATISLDTKDKRYVSYAAVIKGKIMKNWVYPVQAREYLIEGRLTALFSLKKSGNMVDIAIIRRSGYEILDNEVIRAIKSAAPFPPFPDSISVNKLNIKADFDYRITARK